MMKIPDISSFSGTPFQKQVWQALLAIPEGNVISYKELARRVGRPQAVRAVANAVGKNPLPVMIPCHRVIRSDGSLGGYSGKGGVTTKRALLKKEGVPILMRIHVFAKTNAKKNRVSLREDGNLLVAVTAQPEKGKANKAIEKAIAKYYDVAPNTVRVIIGQTRRRKVVEILESRLL